MNLPLLTSVLSISCIIATGRKKWWGHLFGVANCIAFTVIAFKPGQWGYLPSNAVCIVLYAYNAWKWHRDELLLKESVQEELWRVARGYVQSGGLING